MAESTIRTSNLDEEKSLVACSGFEANFNNAPQRLRNSLPCRFFQFGACTRLDNCHFSHDIDIVPSHRSFTRSQTFTRRVSKTGNSHNMPSTSAQHVNEAAGLPSASDDIKNQSADTNCNAAKYSMKEDVAYSEGACSPAFQNNWVNAPEFVPSSPHAVKSYAQAVNSADGCCSGLEIGDLHLCPYTTKDGFCRYPPGECNNLHGNVCDLCQRAVLHPYNEDLRKRHNQECIQQHEKDMELSFALARSKEKTCGVCFEIVMEKALGEQRFGILPNCNHCFCLTCIRKWRQARQFENKIIRACPECRITSDFVCPSMYWVDTKEDKDKLIDDYKKALSRKDCKYFKKGSGKCPFGNKCFYLHALVDGRKMDVGPPPRQRRRRHHHAIDDNINVLQQVILWDFLDDRDNPWQSLADDLEDLVSFFTDSDDSDWSDYEFYFE